MSPPLPDLLLKALKIQLGIFSLPLWLLSRFTLRWCFRRIGFIPGRMDLSGDFSLPSPVFHLTFLSICSLSLPAEIFTLWWLHFCCQGLLQLSTLEEGSAVWPIRGNRVVIQPLATGRRLERISEKRILNIFSYQERKETTGAVELTESNKKTRRRVKTKIGNWRVSKS